MRHFIASGFGYFVGSILRTPLEAVKCRQQLCTERVLPAPEIVLHLWSEKRLFSGLPAIMMRDVIPGGLYYAVYFTYRDQLACDRDSFAVKILKKILLGASVGIGYWVIAYPIDFARNIQQSCRAFGTRPKMLQALRSVVREYGYPGLYRGMAMTCTRTVLTSGISMCLFDLVLSFLKADFEIQTA